MSEIDLSDRGVLRQDWSAGLNLFGFSSHELGINWSGTFDRYEVE